VLSPPLGNRAASEKRIPSLSTLSSPGRSFVSSRPVVHMTRGYGRICFPRDPRTKIGRNFWRDFRIAEMVSVVLLDLASRFPDSRHVFCRGILYQQATSTIHKEGGLRRNAGGQETAIISCCIPVWRYRREMRAMIAIESGWFSYAFRRM
jgi:hypothetical protein